MRLASFFALLALSVAPSVAATFTVNNTADVVDASPGDGVCETATGNGVCTLRAAVQEAGATTSANTIVVPAGTYLLSATPVCSYTLVTNTNPSAENMSALCVRGNVTITGAGADSTIIDAGGAAGATCCGSYPSARGMVIPLGAVVNISGIAIQNGRSNGGYTWFGGAAINNQGTLRITNSVLTANIGVPGGGGIWNDGTLVMDNVDLNANSAGGYGGSGLYNDYYGAAEVSHSTFRFGNAPNIGGGIVNLGNMKLLATTVANNIAGGDGGGIYNDSGSLVLTNVTIAANQAFVSGAIWNGNSGTVSANNATIALNHATYHGGGISNGVNSFTTRNSIIGGNYNDSNPSAFTDCEGAITSQGHNLISGISSCRITGATSTDIYSKDPGLAPLSTSPAIDAGDPLTPGSGSTSCASADQRGILRPQGSRCDIGAFEQVPSLSVTGILPANAGNAGAVVAVISGSGIQPGASVRLTRSGQADIVGSTPAVNAGNAELAAAFDVTGAAVGAWDIVVTNPDNSTATLPASFSIQPADAPQVWAQLVGRNPVRPGQLTTYTVAYGNRGNVEAQAVPLIISVPANFTPEVKVTLAQPPAQSGQAATDWSKVPVYLQPGPENGRYNL